MSNIKIIKNLKIKEIEDICNNSEGCAKCPLLISSYNRNIHCLKDDMFPIYETDKVWEKLNAKIDLDTKKLEGD